MTSLLELASRLEAATGLDRELDLAIAVASYKHGFPIFGARVNYDPSLWLERYGPISASLDAAMSLVPEGWRVGRLEEDWRSGRWHCRVTERPSATLIAAFDAGKAVGYDSQEADAATPALALCAAALRARAALRSHSGEDQ